LENLAARAYITRRGRVPQSYPPGAGWMWQTGLMPDEAFHLDGIASIRVFVFDLEAARKFYEETLGLAGRSDGEDYSTFTLGDVRLIMEPVEPTSDYALLVGRFTGFSFEVADVYAAYENLRERGVVFLDPPELQPWGGILAHFEDPDENILTIVQEPAG